MNAHPPPHIFIAGPYGAGKTTLLRTLSELDGADSGLGLCYPYRAGYEVGLIHVDDRLAVYLLGHPTEQAIDPVRDIPANAIGAVFVVSSVEPERFRAARQMLATFQARCPVPFVVAANKQDDPDALAPDDLRAALAVCHTVPIVPCVATDHASAQAMIKRLLHKVVDRIEALEDDHHGKMF